MFYSLFRSVWSYREFVLSSVGREFKTRFKRSLLGGAWVVINPLAQVLIFTLILSEVMRVRLPGVQDKFAYSIYLMAGMLCWSLFSEVVSRSTTMFIENANLLKKLAFPRICLPIILTLSSLINHAIMMAVFLAILAFLQHLPGSLLVSVVPVMALVLVFALGLGIVLGVLNVFFRDIGHVLGITLQIWFWLTPIVYTPSILPAELRSALGWNPLLPIVEGYQRVFYLHQQPDWSALLPLTLATLSLAAVSYWLFRRASPDIVDAL